MTVKELINELLEYDMEQEVTIKISLENADLEYEDFDVEIAKVRRNWGPNAPCLTVRLEDKTTESFIED